MKTIGFLACETTLPGAGDSQTERRGDAFEHDLMIAALDPAFKRHGLELRVIGWEAPIANFADIDCVLLGTAWDYQDKATEFIAKIEMFEAAGIRVYNACEVARWNINKTYLRELSERGAKTIPTLWRETVTSKGALEAMEVFGTDRVVVKRQVGAGAMGQELIRRNALPDPKWSFGHAAMLQPFLPAIVEEGELSFIFIDGALSHALRKRPAQGDYRIQSLYGGNEMAHKPTEEETTAAQAIVEALPFDTPLYVRIDMLRGEDGALMVMEAELIEPYLYPEQGPQLGEKLAEAIVKRLQIS